MKLKYILSMLILLAALPARATTYYPAEVVGRDSSNPGLFWFGHVGLTIANNAEEPTEKIIEVLPEINAIQINLLSNFKQRARYWGSRYGIADQKKPTQHIIHEALKQRALCPIHTQTSTYQIGLGTPDAPTRCAVFRSDTFINHVFHTAGYDLPSYYGITLPLRVFYSFPKAHSNYALLPPEEAADDFTKQIDLPPSEVTPDTVQSLWELAKNPLLRLDHRIFILDYLGLNGTAELIEELIAYYKTQTHPAIKNMLIRSSFTLYQTHFLNQPHANLQQFYQNLLEQPLDAEALPFVIRGFVNLSTASQVILAQYQINKQLSAHDQTLPPENKLSLNLLLAFKTKGLENYYISRIVLQLALENNPDLNQLFKQALISRVKRLGKASVGSELLIIFQTINNAFEK